MKTTIKTPTELEITHVSLALAVRYDDEDIPYDFPLREGDMWRATVNIDTGEILDWPKGQPGKIDNMKVCDAGTYVLLSHGKEVARIENNYVPHGVVPGEYGDYVTLDIDERGAITNWPKKVNVSAFFEGED